MKKKLYPFALITLLMSSGSNAYTVYGEGTMSCGSWINEKEKNSAAHYRATTWVAGYVTGVAANLSSKYELREIDVASMAAYITKWCGNNPLENVERGSYALALELITEK